MSTEIEFNSDGIPLIDAHEIGFGKVFPISSGDDVPSHNHMGIHLFPGDEDGERFALTKAAFYKLADFISRNLHELYKDGNG